MNVGSMRRLQGATDRQHFIREVSEMLAPYGSVKRSQLVVDRKEMDTEVICFVEMETTKQAEAAKDGLGMLLLDGGYLFFSAQLDVNFSG